MSLGSSSLKCAGVRSVPTASVEVATGHLHLFVFMLVCACKCLGVSGLVKGCSTLEASLTLGHLPLTQKLCL